MAERFSDRLGYRPSAPPITVREDAPSSLRDALPMIAKDVGMKPSELRWAACETLNKPPDPDNSTQYPYVWNEVVGLFQKAPWYKVYDIAEAIHAKLLDLDPWDHKSADEFGRLLNNFLVEHGIGWELRDGRIVHRGSAVFARSTHEATDLLEQAGSRRAANEMREALQDISRRPDPDVTGAIQHAMAALEATAREVTGERRPTLGKLVQLLDLPAPLDQAVSKLWGYASERGRHIREQEAVNEAEAELIVSVSGALCEFLIQRDS